MKFKLTAISTKADDGEDIEATITRGDVETVEDALYAFGQFMRAAGFTYIEQVGAISEDGKEYWGDF
jgi:hypothetical protein